ncbi:MAG TPA: uracil-DNA glycosylase [Planctomycetota bacterium]|nr:uracil-DNA glycosylase [Planctomycetota bacterium]
MSELSELTDTRRLALERLRFEQSFGVEVVPRVKLERAAPTTVAMPVVVNAKSASAEQGTVPRHSASVTTAPMLEGITPDKEERWRLLEARAKACVNCVLHEGRTNVVFGTGNRKAKLVFVGEGPGQDEDLQGEPFVGRAGQLLNKIIGAMGLKREDVYICNTVKCRPPNNRTPLPDEIAACSPFLTEQLELISPRVIVALGAPAAKTLLNTSSGITSLRGRWHWYKTIPVMPTFHPAFVLRQYTEEVRRQVWEDMKKVMEKLKS